MASILEELVEVLENESVLYEELYLIAIEKRKIIIENDLEMLKRFNSAEGIIASKIQKLEIKRIEHIEDVGIVFGKSSKNLLIKDIVELIKDSEEKQRLEEVSKKIKSTLIKLQDRNKNNKELIDSALKYVDVNLNLIKSVSGEQVDNYQPEKNKSYLESGSTFDKTQ